MVLRALHLCSGYGGFELALRGVARTVAHVERDAYAAATLVARMGESRLDQAPIWSDLTTFDGEPWRGRVDLITGGIPCQPFSVAGKRMGLDDDRWLWPDIERIIREVRPRYVFLENVPGVVRAGLPAVLHSLADLGFDAEWGMLRASAVGAPHRRERFWLVAYAAGNGRVHLAGGETGDARYLARDGVAASGEDVADTASLGRLQGHGPAARHGWPEPAASSGHAWPPRPDDHDGWAEWDGAQPAVRRGPDGSPRWLADALHLGGNGLVPQCARVAWDLLTERGAW